MPLLVHLGEPSADAAERARHRRTVDGLAGRLRALGHEWSPPSAPPPPGAARHHLGSLPCSSLRRLRRIAGLRAAGRPVTPLPPDRPYGPRTDTGPEPDPAGSHLFRRLRPDGYYLPVPADPGMLEPGGRPSDHGERVGSSSGLLAELVDLAPALGIRLTDDGTLDDAEAARLFDSIGDPFDVERMIWLTLYEACRISVDTGHAVVVERVPGG